MNWKLTEEENRSILAFRHERHRYPELSHEEFETTEQIKRYLEGIPGVEILNVPEMKTGVIARLCGEREGGEAALRADIDAIRQTEETDLSWHSERKGIMHACGHDFHMAALLGAAHLLSRHKKEFFGTVDLIFQKAEEDTSGMAEMIEEGMLEVIHPQVVFGEHNYPALPVGQVACHRGALMAGKVNARIRILGKGGHGSTPHLTTDPIVAAAALVTALQTVISRNMDPLSPGVLTVGYIHGGTPDYLVVDEAELGVSIRALSHETMENALSHFEMLATHTAQAYGCRCEIIYEEKLPCVENPESLYELACLAAEKAVGRENVVDVHPVLASEDFAVLQEKIPGWFYWIGSGIKGKTNPAWHQKDFKADDGGIAVAAEVLAQAAALYLNGCQAH